MRPKKRGTQCSFGIVAEAKNDALRLATVKHRILGEAMQEEKRDEKQTAAKEETKDSLLQTLVQFIKFNVVGLLNTGIDALVYYLLGTLAQWTFWPAKVVSYSAGVINSWFWNSRWTFREHDNKDKQEKGTAEKGAKRFASFIVVNLCALLVSLGVLAICRRVTQAEPTWWMNLFFATPASLIVNFVGNKFLVFRKEAKDQVEIDPVGKE